MADPSRTSGSSRAESRDEIRAAAGLVTVAGAYPREAPYHPDERFPEYGSRPIAQTPNPVYRAVRDLFRRLGFDAARHGTAAWNPLGHLVRPGDRVFIKPNLVTHEHRASCSCSGNLFAVITHPAVVRAVADYAAIALSGRGEIVIGDNPSIDADFTKILEHTRLDSLPPFYGEQFALSCRVLDLRPVWTPRLADYGFRTRTTALAGDPEGSSLLNLGRASRFFGIDPSQFRGVFTNRRETIRHHSGERQEYSISNTILNTDVFISVPKLKAHHKVGATLNVKGLVGINSNKNLLPHWRVGYATAGGDEFPTVHRPLDPWRLRIVHALEDTLPESVLLASRRVMPHVIARLFDRRTAHSHERFRGAWDGNDTCWRMAADLYAAFIQDRTGWRARHGKAPLRTLSVIDGVTAGEGDGPFCPTPRQAQVLVGSTDLLLADALAVRFMDFNIGEVRYLTSLLEEARVQLGAAQVISDLPGFTDCFHTTTPFGRFTAPQGWPRLSTVAAENAA
jgi:uncharacterized protein (DUF362 family)